MKIQRGSAFFDAGIKASMGEALMLQQNAEKATREVADLLRRAGDEITNKNSNAPRA